MKLCQNMKKYPNILFVSGLEQEESEMKFRSCIRGFNSGKEGYV